jgi:hypothetical protein
MAELTRNGQGEVVPVELWLPAKHDGRVVVWVHPEGRKSVEVDVFNGRKGPAVDAFNKLLAQNAAVCVVEPFRTGELVKSKAYPVDPKFAGFTFGYNRPLVAERVHDILTAVAWAKAQKGVKSIDLVGFGEAGPWVALARGLCGDAVVRTAADLNGFRFEQIKDANDPMMLPGGLKYGGLLTLASLAAPHELLLHNTKGCGTSTFLNAAFEAAGQPGRLTRREERMTPEAVVNWLLR